MKAKKTLSLVLAVAMLIGVLCMSVSATGSYDPVSIGEGEPVTINWNGTTGAVVSVDGTSYIPRQFVLWARNGYTVKVNGTAVAADGVGDTDSAYTIHTGTSQITITADNGTAAYTITCPAYTTGTGGVNPTAVNGYLPVGQFARPNSFGWGCLYPDNSNVPGEDKTAKFLSGFSSVGVSLGMGGGYIQFDMGNNRIINDPNNKYGIDFIIYGNAFVGNPEAAGVQVSNDGVNWYTLAGSRHYMDGTQWNQNISYIKIEAGDTTIGGQTFESAGIYCSTNFAAPASNNASDVNAAIGAAAWTGIPALSNGEVSTATAAGTGWWPEYANDENYGSVWNIGSTVNGVHWLRNGSAEVISYEGVTLVEDDMAVLNREGISSPSQAQMSDVYQWGYGDVRPNGSSYGTATNPYAAAASTQSGGDGFDLSWAVKADGTPISISSVRYVRVYSAVLFNAGAFGETSAEVCGLYVANAESSNVGTSSNVELWADDAEDATPLNVNAATTIAAGTYYLYSSETNVYVNGNKVSVSDSEGATITIAAGEKVQIVAQSGSSAPFLTVLAGK